MANKKKLGDLLTDEPVKPVIRRGQGLMFSTDAQESQKFGNPDIQMTVEEDALSMGTVGQHLESPARPVSPVVRVKLGNAVRKDLVTAIKRIALDQERHDYEVIEEALHQYIERYHQRNG